MTVTIVERDIGAIGSGYSPDAVARVAALPDVTAKFQGRFRTGDGKPVVALDIDGTLGDYHSHFLWFAEKWLGREMPPADQINPGLRLSEFMGIPHSDYRECKLAYRQGGLKRFMPAYSYASELTTNIRERGAEVWVCTTRPYLRLDNIDPDTREWLHRNDIHYDAVIFGGLEDAPGKYFELVRQVGKDRVVAVTDDLPDQIDEAFDAGAGKLYVRDQPYNREEPNGTPRFRHPSMVTRAYTLRSLWYYLQADIEKWWSQHG